MGMFASIENPSDMRTEEDSHTVTAFLQSSSVINAEIGILVARVLRDF